MLPTYRNEYLDTSTNAAGSCYITEIDNSVPLKSLCSIASLSDSYNYSISFKFRSFILIQWYVGEWFEKS